MSDKDTIYRQDAIDEIEKYFAGLPIQGRYDMLELVKALPSAEPVQKSRLAREIEGLTPEETYDFLNWLLHGYGLRYTDSKQAVIEWLRGERYDILRQEVLKEGEENFCSQPSTDDVKE